MTITPHASFQFLGTSVTLREGWQYVAIPARNQPDWQARRSVFVLCEPDGTPLDAVSVVAALNGSEEYTSVLLHGEDYRELL
jgi:hypothetical protein